MIREDLITQMIKQIAALVARILRQNISKESLEEELDSLSLKWVGLPSELLLALPPEEAFRLFEDSERMVIEKCYFMGEVCRLKGIKSESPEAQKEFNEKALFFYAKCSGKVGAKLQEAIDETIAGLRIAGHETPYTPPAKDESNALQPPDPQRHDSPSRTAHDRKTKKKPSPLLWYAIAACVIGMLVQSFSDKNEIEIIDPITRFDGNLAQAEFQIVNNTDEERLIRLRLSVEHTTNDTFGSKHSYLGSVDRAYTVAPQATQTFAETFEYALDAPRANQTLSIAMLSSDPADTTPANAPR